jgi:hypothetical protein
MMPSKCSAPRPPATPYKVDEGSSGKSAVASSAIHTYC